MIWSTIINSGGIQPCPCTIRPIRASPCTPIVSSRLGLSITAGAKALGISRQALSSLVNGHTSITPEMAVRLAKAFGSTADTWIRLQAAWEIAQVRKWADEIKVERHAAAPPALD